MDAGSLKDRYAGEDFDSLIEQAENQARLHQEEADEFERSANEHRNKETINRRLASKKRVDAMSAAHRAEIWRQRRGEVDR